MNSRVRTPGSRGAARGAFTLVEMLVAVGLVVLMMTLFATIFQMATGAMATTKGLAENDQRVRLVLTRLRNDLNGNKSDPNDPNRPYRTFRNIVPFGPDEVNQTSGASAMIDRQGYFYISENDPNDDTDDVLALTVFMPSGSSELFFGRADVVFQDFQNPPTYGPGNPNPGPNSYPPAAPTPPTPDPLQVANPPGPNQQYYPNQPEFDDIQGVPNGAGDSQCAEVCYFLRRGTLYRRVLLIRQPNVSFSIQDGTPTDNVGGLLDRSPYMTTGGPNSRNFWTDFDYAAFFDTRSGKGLRFHGTGNTFLAADSMSSATTLVNPFRLGNPAYRFGFDCTTPGGNPGAFYGQPREYVNGNFIGRFTQAETSHPAFGYPGNLNGLYGNPMDNTNANLTYNPTTGTVSNYAPPLPLSGGIRAGEDVLMTNVIKFDIKVFDPAASVGPDGLAGVGGVDDDNDGNIDFLPNGQVDVKELGWPGSDDGDFRDLGHNGTTGLYSNPWNQVPQTVQNLQLIQHVPLTMLYSNQSNLHPNFTDLHLSVSGGNPRPTPYYTYPNTNYSDPRFNRNRYDTWSPTLSLTPADASAIPPLSECPPFRPFNYGPDGKPGIAGIDDDGNGVFDDAGELGWLNSDDQPIPLGAIQIKITFYDRTSKQVREATLVQSLLYTQQ